MHVVLNINVIIVGEWWKSDTENVINEALKSGLAPNVSDAHTINGHPGPISNCQTQGKYIYMYTKRVKWYFSKI